MLKPIQSVSCFPALGACQKLMQNFALWLCDTSIAAVDITEANCLPPRVPSDIEGA